MIGTSPAFNDHSLALQLTHADGTVSISISVENSICLNTWQHVAVTYDANSSEVKMYLNGKEQIISQTKTPSGIIADNSTNDLIIGSSATTAFCSDGVIDEIWMWNILRSKQQIQTHINQDLNGDEAGLVGYWKMNEGNGELIKDYSNHQREAAIVGAQWVEGAPLNLPTAIGMKSSQEMIPEGYYLYANYPNPFNSSTMIQFSLTKNTDVSMVLEFRYL